MYSCFAIIPNVDMILNKKYNIKVIAIFIFCCFSYGQSLSSDNYKTTLRMKLEIDKNPALYLDEPLSADLEKIHKACKVYIYLHERKSDSEMIQHSGNEIKMSVERMKKKVYNPNLPIKTKKYIRYQYISVGRD